MSGSVLKFSVGSSRFGRVDDEKTPARILIADDNNLVRQHLRFLLESNPEWEVCGEARDGREALQKTRQLHPDLVVVDFSMPFMNGLQAAEGIAAESPQIPVLLFSQFVSRQLVDQARKRGIRGAVAKCNLDRDLPAGVHALLKRHEYFPT